MSCLVHHQNKATKLTPTWERPILLRIKTEKLEDGLRSNSAVKHEFFCGETLLRVIKQIIIFYIQPPAIKVSNL